jgi:hypothetical protein
MLNINKIVKKNIENLLETKGFEDMEVAFGVRHKSDNLSDAEKNQFGPMGQLKTTDGGSFKNPDINGMKVTDASKKEAGSEAQAYYREVAKKVKDFQKPDDGQTIGGPRVPTNTGDDNERLENTGYDIGISGMEVVADLAAEKGGSEETKKIYKDRVAKLQGDKSNYTPMSKNAKETNDLKYKKDARNTRPVKSQTSKQVEEGLENSSDIVTEADFKISSDVEKLMSTIETKVKKMYPKLFQRVDQPVEKAQIIALFAKIFGISPQELSRVKTVMDKAEKSGESTQSTEESDNNTDSMTENTFKVKGKIISEQQVLKLTKKLPAKIKIDETVFSVTDGETTYKLIWEGDSKTGEAVITNKNNKTQVNEDIQKMKHLWNFDSKESLSTKKNIKEDGEDAFRRIFKKIKEDKK